MAGPRSSSSASLAIFTLALSITFYSLVSLYQGSGGQGGHFDLAFLKDQLSFLPPPTTSSSRSSGWDPQVHSLAVPPGEAQNLPSIRVEDESVSKLRQKGKGTNYGGDGDKAHLGGFTQYDGHGVAPYVWKNMMQVYGVRSLVDVGCGRGTSTLWFLMQGVDVLCVEGSHDAVTKSLLPDISTHVVEHDFSRGPYWPAKTYDAVWSVEFLEHVGVNFHYNYVQVWRKAALIFVTSSRWGGWHHVEVHKDDWWIRKFESYGFIYSPEMSDQVKGWARKEGAMNLPIGPAPDGHRYGPQHVTMSMKVFINPAVAALPQHAHLFPEPGCFVVFKPPNITTRPCDASKHESVLPPEYEPIPFKPDKQREWVQHIRDDIGLKGNETLK